MIRIKLLAIGNRWRGDHAPDEKSRSRMKRERGFFPSASQSLGTVSPGIIQLVPSMWRNQLRSGRRSGYLAQNVIEYLHDIIFHSEARSCVACSHLAQRVSAGCLACRRRMPIGKQHQFTAWGNAGVNCQADGGARVGQRT